MSQFIPGSGLRVNTGYAPVAVMLGACTPRLVLDGEPPLLRPWGETFIAVSPGQHSVRCWFKYALFTHAGDATVTVDVPPGQVVTVFYRAPAVAVASGQWTIGPVQPFQPLGPLDPASPVPASTPITASWFPDPTGVHQLRYWDGATWTPHVSDNGVIAVDPA